MCHHHHVSERVRMGGGGGQVEKKGLINTTDLNSDLVPAWMSMVSLSRTNR